jgi:hypothetical protein
MKVTDKQVKYLVVWCTGVAPYQYDYEEFVDLALAKKRTKFQKKFWHYVWMERITTITEKYEG